MTSAASVPSPGTVLITGATGFAGSFLLEQYAARGWQVHGTFRTLRSDASWVPDDVVLHKVDLREAADVFELIAETRPDVVQHLAAQSSVSASWNDPMGTLADNSTGQYNLLEAVRALTPTARVLVVGSSDEYGSARPDECPIAETHELMPLNPYGLSKVAQDLMGYQYHAVHGLQIVRARPFLQIGPRRAPRFVAGSFARQIAEIESGLREARIDVGNVDLQRDFTDVRDVVRAYAAIAESGVPGDVYNIASGTAHSLRTMLDIMLEEAGIKADIHGDTLLQRQEESQILVGDAGKLQRTLDWRPVIPFEQSVRDTVNYWREYVRSTLVREGEA